MDWMEHFPVWLSAFATVGLCGYAAVASNSLKHSRVNRCAEFAEDLLTICYEAEDALGRIRSFTVAYDEMLDVKLECLDRLPMASGEDREAANQYFDTAEGERFLLGQLIKKRYRQERDIVDALFKARLQARVMLDDQVYQDIVALHKIFLDVWHAADRYHLNYQPDQLNALRQLISPVVEGGQDKCAARINQAVSAIRNGIDNFIT